ncbi:MAG: pilus assembly protein CpaF [bacterium]|nr:pilus assembly protein CpaF [bacterium]MDY4101155.1 pilus assembly protein CpaF [Lachnospiraceae bacterium]
MNDHRVEPDYRNRADQTLDLEGMVHRVGEHVNRILRENLYEMNLDAGRLKRLARQKKELRDNLARCGVGDDLAKAYVLEFLQESLLKLFHLNERTIDTVFYYRDTGRKNAEYLFDRLLFLYKKKYGPEALGVLIRENGLLEGTKQVISREDILAVYERRKRPFSFVEKLELLTWKIYSAYKGLGIIDEIRDMNVDGVSGGVSGMPGDHHSVWMFYQGRSVHLAFLDFKSERELERICRSICRFEQPGELSRARGYLVHEMADHSRVVVARPDFAESWMFFVRKLGAGGKRDLSDLFSQPGAQKVIELLQWLVKGCQVVGITGMQGCGKTTLLMALVESIPPEYTLRVLELAFELHLRRWYPERNIVTFRETPTIDGWEGLELQKKTDGAVSIIGEVASARVAAWMVESGQVGSLFTLFTHHAKTTRALVMSLRNSLLKEGSFSDERVATEQVVSVVNFDVHLHLDREGRRYIERITQIREAPETAAGFETVDLITYEDGAYRQAGWLDALTRRQMERWLSETEREAFRAADI